MDAIQWLIVSILAVFPIVRAPVAPQEGQSCRVEVGCCAGLKDIDAVRSAGFDYLEVRVAEVEALTDENFQKLQARLKELKLATPAANSFLPGRIKVTGPSVDPEQQLLYVRKALDRVSSIGVKVIVFGSSGSRNVPTGFDREQAFRQLVDFCRRIAPEAEAREVTILIEPLRPEETNIINTVAEGLALVEAVGQPRIQLLADYYHMACQKEDVSIVDKAGAHILHTHIANPVGRAYPKPGDGCDYAAFFAALRRIKYCGRMSVEAGGSIAVDGPVAYSLIHDGMK